MAAAPRRRRTAERCTGLAMERSEKCCTGNSQVKPVLQVIDDSGTFRGWIGVEASFWPNGGPNPRASDMLSVGEPAGSSLMSPPASCAWGGNTSAK